MLEEKAQPTTIDELQPKMRLEGVVTRTELYGAFVDLGLGRDGLIHISRLADHQVKKVTDEVKVGDRVTVWVQSIDTEKGRIALTMVRPAEVDWDDIEIGRVFTGKVTRLERYGAFVDIGAERSGLLHIHEMGQFVRSPEEVVKQGETVQVRVMNIDRGRRQITLTMNLEPEVEEVTDEDEAPSLSPMEIAYQQAQSLVETSTRRARSKPRVREQRDELEDIYRRTLRQGN